MDSKILNDALYSTYTKFSETAHGKNTQRGLEQIIAACLRILIQNAKAENMPDRKSVV